jgi:hypothetical protein
MVESHAGPIREHPLVLVKVGKNTSIVAAIIRLRRRWRIQPGRDLRPGSNPRAGAGEKSPESGKPPDAEALK